MSREEPNFTFADVQNNPEFTQTRTGQGQDISNGNQDPTGEFPRLDYHFRSNINSAALGSRVNTLYLGGGAENLPLNLPRPGPSQYPLNQVQETASGHIIEIDDTPGNERVLIRHNSGAGVELTSQGDVVVSSRHNKVEVVGADHSVIVEGEGNLTYRGNLNLRVTGDLNIDCLNYNLTTRGNKTETTSGSNTTNVGGNNRQTVGGSESFAVAGSSTHTYLSGQTNSVKGNYSLNVDGHNSQFASGDANITSDKMNLSSNNANIAAQSLSVFGATGTIGGEGVVYYGKGATFGEGVTAPTFHGALEGNAKTATQAGRAGTAGDLGAGGSGGTEVNVATPTTALPTSSNITSYLQQSANGIRRVFIDVGNFIRNSISRSVDYGGVSNTTMSTERVRSALRDPANSRNSTFVATAISEGILSPSYALTAPGSVGRIVSGSSTPRFGQQSIGNISFTATADPFVPRRGSVNLVPDPKYNPNFLDRITIRTRLAPGVQIAKFFGTSDPAPLDFIRSSSERIKLARQLYLHAEVIRSIQTNEADFADFRLSVVEGIYRPGPTETITPGSINDLKLKGRAVVYSLVNSDGMHDNSIMFDLAEYWKDTLYFEKLILAYDNYGTDNDIKAYIVLIMPEITADWTGVFAGEVQTTYNGNTVTQGELVECFSDPNAVPQAAGGSNTNTEFEPNGENGRLPDSALVQLRRGGKLRADAASDWDRMQDAAARDGVTLTAGSTYRTYQRQLELWNSSTRPLSERARWVARPGRSNHGWGIAVDVSELFGRNASNAQNVAAYRWLSRNAARFNFYQRMSWEPWHWEYTINNPYR
jgi:LAS superfamily LD-carboxypeptidase LdcB